MSPTGIPEFAITDGAIVLVSGANKSGRNRLGGRTVMLEAAHDIGPTEKGGLFCYAHTNRESVLPIGTKVRAGQRIGGVGDTGEGQEAIRGNLPPHLHLGWYDTASDRDRALSESGAMNPYPLLVWLEENGGALSGGKVVACREASQELMPELSAGKDSWLTPDLHGTRPDLDTGSAHDPVLAPPSRRVGNATIAFRSVRVGRMRGMGAGVFGGRNFA